MRIAGRLRNSMLAAGAMLLAAAGVAYAQATGAIDADTATRGVNLVLGLVLAGYGNMIPKRMIAWCGSGMGRRGQTVARVSGWSFALAGLGYAAIWTFAALQAAAVASIVVIAAALVINFVCAVWALAAERHANKFIV
jgi:hypothetical protein